MAENKDVTCTCPLCALWKVYKTSEAAQHVRAIKREGLLLARSLINACIKKAEEKLATREKRGS